MSDINLNIAITADKGRKRTRSPSVQKKADTNGKMVNTTEVILSKFDNHKNGVQENEPDRIVGVTQREGKVLFFVAWKNSINGEAHSLLDADDVNDKYPQLIIQFYVEQFGKNPTTSSRIINDKDDHDENVVKHDEQYERKPTTFFQIDDDEINDNEDNNDDDSDYNDDDSDNNDDDSDNNDDDSDNNDDDAEDHDNDDEDDDAEDHDNNDEDDDAEDHDNDDEDDDAEDHDNDDEADDAEDHDDEDDDAEDHHNDDGSCEYDSNSSSNVDDN